MANRYELSDGTSNKFWEIDLQGKSFVARWGRIGSSGQEKKQSFKNEAEARKAHDKLVAEKTKKGYRLVAPPRGSKSKKVAAGAATVTTAKTKTKTKPLAPNPKLEAMLADNRDDKGSWQVYADWLLEQGEPWGEVIVQACGKGKRPKKRFDEVESTLLEEIDGASLVWKNGVIDHLELAPEKCPETKDGELRMPRVLASLLRHPSGRLVRAITLGLPPRVPGDINWSFDDVMAALCSAGPLPLLEVLDLTPDADHMDQQSWRRVGDLRGLWKAAPRLRELRMKGSSGSDRGVPIRFGTGAAIEAPRLETLIYISSGLAKEAPVEIGKAKFPRLNRLELYFGSEDYGNTCTIKSLGGILEGKGLPKLKTLGLMNSPWDAELIEAIAKAPILKRLENLDLSYGVLFSQGAEALLRHASKFSHLASIKVHENYIPNLYALRFRKSMPNVKFGEQRGDEQEDEYRFVAIGE